MNRIRSLDGIRAISILLVLLGHARETIPVDMSENKLFYLFSNSGLGVKIFFVISGYLITKLLMIEREKTGAISIKDFYLRRIFRIFPVFYLYILVLLVLKWFFIPGIFNDYTLIVFAGLYLWNYKDLFIHSSDVNGSWFMGHLWSLSMEEQFYLLWPITFLKLHRSTLIKLVIAIILMMPVIRVATYFLMPGSRGQINMMLHTGGDSILVGCLGAMMESSRIFKEKWKKQLSNNLLIIPAAFFLFVLSPIVSKFYLKGAYSLTIGQSVSNLCIMIMIFWSIYIPSKVADLLNSKILVRIGVLSYSLYIWQQLFLTDKTDSWLNKFPQNLVIVFIVAFISYYIVEKPILNLKKRFQKPKIKVAAVPAGEEA